MKKINAAFKFLLCGILLTVLIPVSKAQTHKKLFNDKDWTSFSWDGMKLGNRSFDKAVMNVPFNIEGISYNFYLQLDLGATSTMLYGNDIDYFLKKDPALAAKIDTVHKPFMLEGKMNGTINDLHTHIDGKLVIFKNNLVYFKGFGDTLTADSFKTKKPRLIGTIGAPFFADKTLIIDYPNKRFIAVDSLDEATRSKFEFVDCRLENGRIKIPFTIGGTVYWLMFDTGSSIFAIMTNKKYYSQFTGNTTVDSLAIPSWGKMLEVYGRQISQPVKFGSLTLPQNFIYMMGGNTWDDFYNSEKIIGITGNAFFLNNVIAIDFKNKKFGVYKYGELTK